MIRYRGKIENIMNDFNVKKKLIIIYVFCMILPLVLTDSIILYILYDGEKKEQIYEFDNVTDAVKFNLEYIFEEAVNGMNDIYVDGNINDFLNEEYGNGYDFYSASVELSGKSSLDLLKGYNISNVVIYADNDTIVNGGHFYRLSDAEGTEWYQAYMESGNNMVFSFYYIGESDKSASSMRRVSLVRHLNYFKKEGCEKILRLDLDYNNIARKLMLANYGYGIYVCQGDRILFSNEGHSSSHENFHELTGKEPVAYKKSFTMYGEEINILVMKPQSSVVRQLEKHMPLILFLVVVNLFLPMIMVSTVNRSFTQRLWELGAAFDQEQGGSLQGIENVRGKDEIGILMQNYNRMVKRMNDLIQRIYKDRLERQEIDLARQNAELLALHSQINPHFLFNVLESIRMRSVIQGEEETARMIEKLAILERQNINWASDNIKLAEEMSFVEAYLELQQYRFGNRLHYEIDLPETCADYDIPKLTLTTFVENSCVHGMEKKASACWIYVRVYLKETLLCIEIEDTGGGMEEEAVAKMNESMRNCTIEDIKENSHIGIINACLRLKMISKGNVEFYLESEKGIGTFMTICVESEYLQMKEQEGQSDVDESNVSG